MTTDIRQARAAARELLTASAPQSDVDILGLDLAAVADEEGCTLDRAVFILLTRVGGREHLASYMASLRAGAARRAAA